MTAAVLAVVVPPPPPPPNSPGWESIEVTWEAYDGSLWRLTDPRSGIFIMRGGVRGLGTPKGVHYRDQSPAVHGATWRGLTYDPREVFWPIYLYSDASTAEYIKLDRAFWDSLHPEYEGTMTVRVPGFTARKIRLRYIDDGNWTPERDPAFVGWTTYGITLQADQPLWEGETVVGGPWQASTPVPFHGGTDPGDPIINISKGRTLATATIHNPGQIEAWGKWKIDGPCTSATIDIDGHVTEVPIELEVNQSVTIDMRPTEQTALRENGTDVFELLGETDFAPIPAGGNATLTLDVDETGAISVELVPLYFRGL